MDRRLGMVAEPYEQGRSGRLMRPRRGCTVGGGRRSRSLGGRSRGVAPCGGAAYVAGSVTLRFGVFEAGMASARDPKYTVVPQRERLRRAPGLSGPAQVRVTPDP